MDLFKIMNNKPEIFDKWDSKLTGQMVRGDGWKNILSGQGTAKDPLTGMNFVDNGRLSSQILNSLYKNSSITAKIINMPSDDCTKKDICIKETPEPSDKFLIMDQLESLEYLRNLNLTYRMARLQGGAVWIPEINSSQDQTPEDFKNPLNYEDIQDIGPGFIIDGSNVIPYVERTNKFTGAVDLVPWNNARFSSPTHYKIQETNIIYHVSRVIVFDGEDRGRYNREINQGWGESVVSSSLLIAIYSYESAHNKLPSIFDKFIQSVFKFDGLNKFLDRQGDCSGEKLVKQKMEIIELTRSIFHSMVIDKQDDWEYKTANISGIRELIDNPERYLIALSNIPHTRLLGEAPSASLGSNTGNSELKEYYDWITQLQNNKFTKPINKLISMIQGMNGINDRIHWEFQSLFILDEKDQAEADLKKAQTKKTEAETIVLLSQVFGTEELINGLRKDPEFAKKFHIEIDNETREALNNIEVE